MSTGKTEIKFNLDGLENLKKQIGSKYVTRVGILGDNAIRTAEDKASPGGAALTNAELGVIQMFGSITNNIPPRDFLLMPLQKNRRELLQSMGSVKVKQAMEKGDYKLVFKLLGVKAEEFIQMAFESAGFGQWPANKPATVRAKGSSAPLIASGQLRKAITSDVVNKEDAGKAVGNIGAA